MKHNSLKRMTLTLALAIASVLAASAQQGLNIDNVFKRYGHAKGCKMVEMHDTELRGYELKVYKSLTYKNLQPSIDPYLKADKKKAKKIREVVENGRVVSGYYMMPPLGGGVNRYILFSLARRHNETMLFVNVKNKTIRHETSYIITRGAAAGHCAGRGKERHHVHCGQP